MCLSNSRKLLTFSMPISQSTKNAITVLNQARSPLWGILLAYMQLVAKL